MTENPDAFFDSAGTVEKVIPLRGDAKSIPTPKPRFVLEPLASIEPALTGAWLIKGLLPSHGLAAVYGPPGCGKSFVTLDAMLHVAAGLEWAGRKVKQTGVVYIAAEGGVGFRKRVVAARNTRHIPKHVPFALITSAPNLGTEQSDAPALIEAIKTQSATLGFVPGVVVLDTLARTIPGADENSSRDIGLFVRNADIIARDLGCLVLVVHHSGKTAERGMRGSSALHGATDAEWEISSDEGEKTIRVAKQKDGEDGLSWMFRLDGLEVGTDEDGEPITTCVVEIRNTPKHSERAGGGGRRKLSGQKAEFLKAVTLAIEEAGEIPPGNEHIPVGVKCVSRERLKRYAVKLNFIDESNPNSVRATLSRNVRGLAGDGYIGQWGDWVWLVS